MSLFNFNHEEILSFFAVLVRFSVLITVLPFVGDKFIPSIAKILFALAISVVLYPALVTRSFIRPGEALVWGMSVSGIVGTIVLEALFGLVLGYTARLTFDSINFGSNLAGNFMGFATASSYDPHQESQTQVIAELQMALAMLIFLVLDGHHIMLRATLNSYQIVGLGKAGFTELFNQKLIQLTGQVIRFGIQIAAPMAVSLFSVNIIFGILAKSMPQLNVLVLSFAMSSIVGFMVMLIGVPEFQSVTRNILERMDDWLLVMMQAMAH